ncbi:MAG: DUF1491 family protein [Kordiimonadaceae bacterium]|nr:DUF1491 family protein [Kordiimonadaceae bacterium]MBO6568449.1 DUF1491 family protein [Kordiimonadaceae bacterium]MBO6963822.1 DUF1491 family protein [Kordiimonadaceae bacterium]
MVDALKTKLWIDAHIRACFAQDMPAFVLARGDEERGGILLKIDRFDAGIQLLERTLDFDGNRVWRQLLAGGDGLAASDKINKKRSFDEDLWVLEIEDLRAAYEPDAPILAD